MSRILALDTSTDACSVALWSHGEVIEDFRIEPRRHTHLLLPMVEQLLAQAGVAMRELDAIAFGRGPGSFAGIRIATGAAQGLALALDCPLLPVSTLEAMALDAAQRYPDRVVLTALDARMDEVYWAAYRVQAGEVLALVPERVAHPGDVSLPETQETWQAVGSGGVYFTQLPETVQARLGVWDQGIWPRASQMLPLALQALERGQAIAADAAQPVYLRDEVAWKKKDQQ
ncbi:tRNA (adenosine(37)-N6)-threonylcarbamoyltransferase complex dimerization subunit type 1 TsaB [Nitrincola tapanii]|uniref:tRNA threonylcarbamoyladenosine biosynthesis protein TsaB n=1 Tax=Nitrincola tapanii TaxID=1708751 RepID=A0A5A9VZA2_9GAMM|nr:tRNA (adenosine(37)-N6)-threonylcarbamoyltransferase complex dimerization subunit type 1 TsaB [Nitrincola tapanii]KAA0873857.1 tRNA (adenosine(37)-N6)-threonylcarbamoyltransferase complex dimerization subunit type 1 TsaB [Nitrincola tapanii]